MRDIPGRRLDPKVRALWRSVSALYVVVLSVAAGVAAALLHGRVWAAVLLAAVLTGLPGAVLPSVRYRRWRYQLRDEDLLTSQGFLFFSQTVVPFDRIQFVESRQGPLDRLYGLYQVVVYTAAGRSASIPGLSPAEADALREQLARIAGSVGV